jgi:NitT/TauT family transport system permease protein
MSASTFTRRDALRAFVVEGPLATSGALALLLVVWQIGAGIMAAPWLPTFSDVLDRVMRLFSSGELPPILVSSLSNLAIGYVVSVVLGLVLGTAMALSVKVHYAFRALVDALLFVPPVLYAPLILAFLGFSDVALVAVIVMFAAFVITVNTQTAVSTVDAELREMVHAFGAGRREMIREVILPGALPQIFAGLRLGMGRAVKGMIIGELFVTVVGLGAIERRFASVFDAEGVWAIALIVISIAVVLMWAIELVDRLVNWWAT